MTRYATREQLKAALGFSSTDTGADGRLDRALADASREIDGFTHHRFHPYIATLTATPHRYDCLRVRDILAITALRTDLDGDRVYETSWAATDYYLSPENAAENDPPEPYWSIDVAPLGTKSFPRYPRSVQVVGKFGYYEVLEAVNIALSTGVNSTATVIPLASTNDIGTWQTLLIDDEQVEVTGGAGSSALTVKRAQNGSSGAAHSSLSTVQAYRYPVINTVTILHAERKYRREDSPMGIAGSPEFGTVSVRGQFDPDVLRTLRQFKDPAIG